ncbi:unnamed protein product [Lathyrus oleraceus]
MKFIASFVIFFLVYVPNCSIAQYEFLKIVEQWRPATCLQKNIKCARNPNNFTLHGLWPSNSSSGSSSSDPIRCTHTPFKSSSIQTLFPRINNSWPDVIRGNEEIFWKHVAGRHCSTIFRNSY